MKTENISSMIEMNVLVNNIIICSMTKPLATSEVHVI